MQQYIFTGRMKICETNDFLKHLCKQENMNSYTQLGFSLLHRWSATTGRWWGPSVQIPERLPLFKTSRIWRYIYISDPNEANTLYGHHRTRHAILFDMEGHSHRTQHNSSISFSSWYCLCLVYYSSHSICRQSPQIGRSTLHQSLDEVVPMPIIPFLLQLLKHRYHKPDCSFIYLWRHVPA